MDSGGNDLEHADRRERSDRNEPPARDNSELSGRNGFDPDSSSKTEDPSDAKDDAEGTETDESGDSSRSRGWTWRIAMALRNGAFVLLPIGFIGLTVTDAWLTPDESPYSLLFAGGIVCAIASIYLAIYQHDIDD